MAMVILLLAQSSEHLLYAIYILMIVFFLMNDYLKLVLVLDIMIIISSQVFKGYVA